MEGQLQGTELQAVKQLCAAQSEETANHIIQVFVSPSGVPGQFDVTFSVERLSIPVEQLEAAVLAFGSSARFISQILV